MGRGFGVDVGDIVHVVVQTILCRLDAGSWMGTGERVGVGTTARCVSSRVFNLIEAVQWRGAAGLDPREPRQS